MSVRFDRHTWMIVISGLSLGLLGALLSVWGNPVNSGICVSCFIENSVGALGLHSNDRMQYLRPELIGFILGAMGSAFVFREFRSRGGSAPLPRLFAGIFLIVGCAVFIGCPIKLFLRLTAGDLTALAGVAGLAVGIWIGVRSLAAGVDPGPPKAEARGSGLLVPALFVFMLALLLVKPAFLQFSARGSAAEYAAVGIALPASLLLGVLAQRTRFCVTGSVRDLFLLGRRAPLTIGMVMFIGGAVMVNILTGRFNLAMYGQPGAHTDHLWSFLGMLLVGWISVILGGCPFRQMIKAGEGDADAGLVVLGMLLGGAIVQSWGIAAGAAGVPLAGKVAVLVGLLLCVGATLAFRTRDSS